jgi:hypothetical protein
MTTSDVSVRWTGHLFAISGSAQNGNNTREADIFRRRGGRTENHDWGRINELGPVMFADAKNIQTDLVPSSISSSRFYIRWTWLTQEVAGSNPVAPAISIAKIQ